MPTWLKSILEEIEQVDPNSFEPGDEVLSYEHVVSVIDVDLRKIYTLSIQYLGRAMEAKTSSLFLQGDARKMKLEETKRFAEFSNFLRDMFWITCQHNFPDLWDRPNIGVRKGWRLIWSDPVKEAERQINNLVMSGALPLLGHEGTKEDLEGFTNGGPTLPPHKLN